MSLWVLNYERPTSPRIVTSKQHSKAYVDAANGTVNTFIINIPFSTLLSPFHGWILLEQRNATILLERLDIFNMSLSSGRLYIRVGILGALGKSNLAKNRNHSRLISNIRRLNWSSERNSVYCFSTVFTLLQQQEVPSTCLPRNLACLVWVQEYVPDLYLTAANWLFLG